MQKIIPNLWANGNAREIADFYTSIFPISNITGGDKYPDSSDQGLEDFQNDLAGKDLTVTIRLAGYDFVIINAGPQFKPTAANSFLVNFDPSVDAKAAEQIDQVWKALIDGGEALIEIGEHPFSKRYGWLRDKYGFTWQLMLTNPEGEPRPYIIPDLLFGSNAQNRAEEAIEFYTSVFNDSKANILARYQQDNHPVKNGAVMFAEFQLAGQWFAAMDSAVEQSTSFTEAVSYQVNCQDQAEIDYFWEKLSAVKDSEQCGWCKDKFGVSWQIVPENMNLLMQKPDAFKTLMGQKKIVIEEY
jgi:predicted 3-demethylubiquinone-9 3-methyltransferase (glyoxalase superfamily)